MLVFPALDSQERKNPWARLALVNPLEANERVHPKKVGGSGWKYTQLAFGKHIQGTTGHAKLQRDCIDFRMNYLLNTICPQLLKRKKEKRQPLALELWHGIGCTQP